MTINELETLVRQLEEQVNSCNVAITSVQLELKKLVSKDDVNTISTTVDTLNTKVDTLTTAVGTIDEALSKVDHLSTLLDVKVDNITVNDILQYSADGKWHNIQPNLLKLPTSSQGGNQASSLNALVDVSLSNVKDGQALIYNAVDEKWINKTITIDVPSGGNTSVDLSNYLTLTDAQKTYLPKTGGTITGTLTVDKLLTVNNNVLVSGGVTAYNK